MFSGQRIGQVQQNVNISYYILPYLLFCLCLCLRLSLSIDIYALGFFFLTEPFYYLFICLLGVAPAAYGSSQARGRIGVVAASLHHSHSNVRFELHLEPTPQLTATQDP